MMDETRALALSAALTWVMLVVAATRRHRGWTPRGLLVVLGNRDVPPEGAPVVGRADRAARNMVENLALFTALVVAVRLSGRAGPQSALGATLFFWARLAYFPVYLVGIPVLRTAIWAVGVAVMAMMLAAAL